MNRSIGLLFAIAAIVTNVGAMSIKMHAQTADVPTATNSTWKTHTAFDGQISKIIEGDRYVYVYKDGKVTYNKVELGRRMGAEYELISGVPDNSRVVIAGQTKLVNGMEVEIAVSD